MENNDTQKMEAKKYILYAILAIIVLLLIIFLSSFLGRGDSSPHYEDDGNTSESVEGGSFVSLKNLDFLSDFIGSTDASNKVHEIIQTEILSDATDQTKSNTASMLSSSLIESVYFPYDTCSFLLKTSEDKSYNVQIAIEKSSYFGMIVRRVVPENEGKASVYVIFLPGVNYSETERERIINSLTKWAKTIEPGELTLTTRNL